MIFDWRGTLFHDISDDDWIRSSAESIGRTLSDEEINIWQAWHIEMVQGERFHQAVAKRCDDRRFEPYRVPVIWT